MNKVKNCPDCDKEVSKSAKKCPHCGKKLKTGIFVKFLIGIIILVILSTIFSPSKEEKAQKLLSTLDNIASAEATNISPSGALAAMFSLMSKNTDIQRDNMEKEITNKIVKWSLPVYEVTKRDSNKYRIQTRSGTGYVGSFVTVYARNNEEITYIETLKTSNIVTFKGKITGTSMRSIIIEPAILIR